MTPKISFAEVRTADRPIKLTQTLFRQVIESPVYEFTCDPPETSYLPDVSLVQGQIIGFVNYTWKGAVQAVYRLESDGVGNDRKEIVVIDDPCYHHESNDLHVLWVTPNGELRRCTFSKELLTRLGHPELKQIFLGGLLFAK